MIEFSHPGFLWGLLALLIPPLIHLFRLQRRKVMAFPDIRLLEALLRESRSTRKITSLLLMAMRMLALAFLILALAGPSVGQQQGNGNTWVLVIDNSRISGLQSGKTTLFQQGTAAADLILQSASEETRIYVVDADTRFQPEALNQQEARERLSQLKPSSNALPAAELTEWVSQWDHPTSLFRVGLPPENTPEIDTLPWTWLPLDAGQSFNVRFDSLWTDPPNPLPGSTFQLKAMVSHSGNSPEDARVEFQLWEGQRLLGSASAALAEEHPTLSFPVSPPDSSARFSLVAIGDKLAGDDTLRFGFEPQEVPEMGISIENEALLAALKRIFTAPTTGNPSVLVTDGSLDEATSFAHQGKVAIVVSPAELPVGWAKAAFDAPLRLSQTDVGQWMRPYLTEIPRENALPSATPLGIPPTSWTPLVRFENGIPFLAEMRVGTGYVYVLNAAPGAWNTHPLTGVLLYTLAFQHNAQDLMHVFLQENKVLSLPLTGNRTNLTLNKNGLQFTPRQWISQQRILVSGMDLEAVPGHYALKAGEAFEGYVGVNPNRLSGVIPAADLENRSRQFPNATFVASMQEFEKQALGGKTSTWTPWLLLLALSFIVLESYWSQYRST